MINLDPHDNKSILWLKMDEFGITLHECRISNGPIVRPIGYNHYKTKHDNIFVTVLYDKVVVFYEGKYAIESEYIELTDPCLSNATEFNKKLDEFQSQVNNFLNKDKIEQQVHCLYYYPSFG